MNMSAMQLALSVPDIGEYRDVQVVEISVQPGTPVVTGQALFVLETDKATLEIPAPCAGVLKRFLIQEGDRVSQGDIFGELALEQPAEPVAPPATPAQALTQDAPAPPAPAATTAVASSAMPETAASGLPLPKAGPVVRKLARTLGVKLSEVAASGKSGRILKEDVEAFVRKRMTATVADERLSGIAPVAEIDFAQFGEIEVRPLPRIQKLSSAHLHRAWLNVPHVTQFETADITSLDALLKAANAEGQDKITLLPLLMHALAQALAQFPQFNASLAADGQHLILKKYINIGFAADTEAGLVVPVVKDANRKGVRELARECASLANSARQGRLAASDIKGGCFTISSLGGLGIRGQFAPIVNAPEVAILGVSRASLQPVWNGEQFVPRLLLPLSLSYDHRVIDGALGSRFLLHLVKLLENIGLLLL
ncbi:2-oxo acid dehydrogenase subunit E2 [Pseudomonas sp. AA-38]|uniref:2-oxo acid dehydrogenase subunit E2 n=1 Tax=Pseudomonas sp. AA-38 TaxID=3028807 RepID=UPI0023F73B38|nr:2-oxo acid dehydrogenase subunit E2 [Pseudomonas sp. AA-38]